MMVIKILSKFELKRLCKAFSCVPLSEFKAPVEDEIGFCQSAKVTEIGSNKVTVFRRETEDMKLSTIVLRGSTMNYIDDIGRAIEDGVSTYRNLVCNGKFNYGAGAIEVLLS